MLAAEEVLGDFLRLLPGFSDYWNDSNNLFRESDGAYTACGVLLWVADFLKERFGELSEQQWRELGRLIRKYFDAGEEMRGVLGACLIENLQFERGSTKVSEHVDQAILRHFHYEGLSD